MMAMKPPFLATRSSTNRSRSSTTKHGHLYRLSRWTRASRRFRDSPEGALCVACRAEGRLVQSECVDHDPPHNGDVAKFWDQSTWRPLCWAHHSAKSQG